MKKPAFTLVEILIALIILSIITAVAISSFNRVVEIRKDKICQQNLRVLEAAIDVYTVENDALPDSLAKLEARHIEIAYQKVYGKAKENRLAGVFKGIFGINTAEAQTSKPLLGKYYGNEKKILVCPADHLASPASTGYTSYDFNPNNLSRADAEDPDKKDYALVADKDFYHKVYDPNKQHGNSNNKFANAVNQYGDIGDIDPDNHINKKIKKWTGKKATSECPSSFIADKTHCCVNKDAWRGLLKKCRDKCEDAGYKPGKDGCK